MLKRASKVKRKKQQAENKQVKSGKKKTKVLTRVSPTKDTTRL
jgi:hypothetical protein